MVEAPAEQCRAVRDVQEDEEGDEVVELRLRQGAVVAREVASHEGHALGEPLHARCQRRSRLCELRLQLDSNYLAPGVCREVAGGPADSGANVQD